MTIPVTAGAKAFLTALALIPFAGPAAAQSLLDRVQGLYFPTMIGAAWNCRDLGADGGAVGIIGAHLRGVESVCRLKDPVPIPGMDAVRFTTTCAGEGTTWDAGPVIVLPTQDGVSLVYQDYAVSWTRCPG